MKKKAQGLSLDTIIIAAIVLIVLIVIWAIFTGKFAGWNKGVNDEQANANLVALKTKKESQGGGCIPKVICSALTAVSASSNCIDIGCTGMDSTSKKCIGLYPEKICSLIDKTSDCNSKTTAQMTGSPAICQWVGEEK